MAPTYKLIYFNIKGLGEPIRFVLSYSDIEFEDVRIPNEDWKNIKPTVPFGKVPVLEVDGKQLHQSVAITRYLGKKVGLCGENDYEDLEIDMAVDTLTDFLNGIASWYYEEDENSKASKQDTFMNNVQPFFYERLDNHIKKNGGYLANGKLSWGDFYLIGVLGYINTTLKVEIQDKCPAVKALEEKVVNIPKIKAWIKKRPETDF